MPRSKITPQEFADLSHDPRRSAAAPNRSKYPAHVRVGEQLEGTANKLRLIDALHDLADGYVEGAKVGGSLGASRALRSLELTIRAAEVAVTL